jgi:hypothetical protein
VSRSLTTSSISSAHDGGERYDRVALLDREPREADVLRPPELVLTAALVDLAGAA